MQISTRACVLALLVGNQGIHLMRLTHHLNTKVFQLVAGEKQHACVIFLAPLFFVWYQTF